ncbi:thioesterase [Desulfosporosinus sp. HMP52]|uniref:PaaI family thioesterase n=1 Tax=Desulfosporosinus sp. HMP52 TaxID=1487923 RepID=UPI00051F88FE|nr:PaaI family thioesterase [Desulfosporosinus sp. HMP52]KGK81083.1 thioesterase [Desulfosporosinus sp. HMP52]
MDSDLMELMKNDRFAAYVGIEIIKVEPGYAITQMEISDKHLNGVDIIQGGVIFTLADFAFAAAANATGNVTVAINSNISYFMASKGKSLIAEAKELSSSKNIANYNVDVFNEHRDHIARLSITGYKKLKQ